MGAGVSGGQDADAEEVDGGDGNTNVLNAAEPRS